MSLLLEGASFSPRNPSVQMRLESHGNFLVNPFASYWMIFLILQLWILIRFAK